MMKRTYGLDVLRAMAILLVVFSHSSNILSPFIPGLKNVGVCGFLGVELFFVLSGFLIGSILVKIFCATEVFNFKILAGFWKRRWFRTLPNYYFFLILNILLLFLAGQFFFDWRYLLFFQNILESAPGFFGESWSLAVEEWFYLVFPLLLFVIMAIYRRLDRRKVFIGVSVGFLLLITLFRLWFVMKYSPEWESGVRKVILLRLDSIMYGVVLAYIKYYYAEILKRNKKVFLVVGIIVTGLMIYQFYFLAANLDNFYLKTFYFSLVSLSLVCLIPFFDQLESSNSKVGGFLTFVSKTSYSIYLLHNSILLVIVMHAIKAKSLSEAILVFLIYWVLVFVLAALNYKLFEYPVTQLREKF